MNKQKPGWWYTYPSEKYESQFGIFFPTEWKIIKFIKIPWLNVFQSPPSSLTLFLSIIIRPGSEIPHVPLGQVPNR
jgi:hypothetical protein